MRELTDYEERMIAGGDDAHCDIGYGGGYIIGSVVDSVRDGYNATVNAVTDALCWATGDC